MTEHFKGHYINGLKPGDFRISEDGIVQKIATFAEGNRPAIQVNDDGSTKPLIAAGEGGTPGKPGLDPRADAFVGTSVFVLFDTSNFMYRGFVYAGWRMRSPISCAAWTGPIVRSPSTRSAAIFRGPAC